MLVKTRRSYRLEDEEGYSSISVAMNKGGLFGHGAPLPINN